MSSSKHVVKVFTGNKGKYRDVELALMSAEVGTGARLCLEQVTDVDPPEIQHLDCRPVAIDKFNKMRDSIPIYNWSLVSMITEDTGLYIGDYMNGFPGAFVKFMEETIGVPGMQRAYSGMPAIFKSTVVVSTSDTIHVLENETPGHISTRPPSGEYGYGFETIFVPTPHNDVNGNIPVPDGRTLAEMYHDERREYSPRSRGYIQALQLCRATALY